MHHRMTRTLLAAAATLTVAAAAPPAHAGPSNIDPAHKHSWGENIGWMNWRDADGGAQGVELLADHLTGFIWAENAGWINLGQGPGPYLNTTGLNYGVNREVSTGRLTGYAWSENLGWLNFSLPFTIINSFPVYDAAANRFRGWVWSENTGWINLDDATHFVGVLPTCPADLNGDGVINASDLALMLGNWGGAGLGDLNNDGTVNASDLALLLGAWGPC